MIDINELLKQWQKDLEELYAKTPINPEVCDHEFKEYVGFTERYFFCCKCDAKSRDGIWID
jgi:hypothetical protein